MVAEKTKVASFRATVRSGPDSMTVSGSLVSTAGLNQGSAPMAAKAAMDLSEVSIRRSSFTPSVVAAGATVESYTTASIPDSVPLEGLAGGVHPGRLDTGLTSCCSG